MGYKRIGSAIHNLAHSFVSLMNYVDDEYIIDILPEVLHSIPDHQLKIHFPGGELLPSGTYPAKLLKSVDHYTKDYSDHLRREGIDPLIVRETEIVIYVDRYGMRCKARAEDDRGKHYEVSVQ